MWILGLKGYCKVPFIALGLYVFLRSFRRADKRWGLHPRGLKTRIEKVL